MRKCSWAYREPIETYHDTEHGYLPSNNQKLFELLTLEIFQPGLSFNIVLQKRSGLATFFKNYNLSELAAMTEEDVSNGLENTEIIRNRLKIESIINNAQVICKHNIDLQAYIFDNIDYRFGLDEAGKLLAKKMKKDGFKFVGPSIANCFLETIGLLGCHTPECQFGIPTSNKFSYQTKFGAITITYDNYKILDSTLIHNSQCVPHTPINSFEQYLIYHIDNYQYHNIYNFNLLLDLNGTTFQKRVWDAIRQVPLGQTRTYGDIAYTIGTGGFQAVGSAAGKCNFDLFIPAWRIVASNGIGGFQNQLELKRELLIFEGIDKYS